MAGDDPSPEALTRAAVAFDNFVRACLRHAGWAASSSAVASMLGETDGNYSRARRGLAISRHRLLGWVGKWVLVTSSGAEFALPGSIRSPRLDRGESRHRPPSVHALEPSLHPDEIEAPLEATSMEVFIRAGDGSVYEGRVYRRNTGGEAC
jgi:hypothetical protein